MVFAYCVYAYKALKVFDKMLNSPVELKVPMKTLTIMVLKKINIFCQLCMPILFVA